MAEWSIGLAREIYNIAHWSDGYFDINAQGNLVAFPDASRNQPGIELNQLVQAIQQQENLTLPVLVRFTDILKHRLNAMRQAFNQACQENEYRGNYLGVYPIKVNQQRRVVEELVQHGGEQFGLEAGSKPELLAVLSLAVHRGMTIVCNGYKDREFIRLALIGRQLGHQVFIIIEKLSEVDLVLEEAAKMQVAPQLGMRVRLASIGAGKWQNTGGEKSKFGLSATQVLQAVEKLRAANQLHTLELLHCHLGSQIANIRDIQRGMRECARFYAELQKLGANLHCMDVGGGLGVDYEGTRSRSFCSMNYSVQEYANNIVHTLKETCTEYGLAHPQIITESGRALTAHHAMLILNATDIEQVAPHDRVVPAQADEPIVIQDLWQALQNIGKRAPLEIYHDACHWLQEAQSLFTHGVINLAQRARAEQLYIAACLGIRDVLQPTHRAQQEVLDELNEKLADKLFINFSLFQSLPDVWAIEQIFPVMPLSGLQNKPIRRGIMQDITCDSDGRIDWYVDGQGLKTTLPLPPYDANKPLLLGVFLVGAYQEILGDMHNLFGDTNSVHVELAQNGSYRLVQPVHGDTVADVLRYVHFSAEDILNAYHQQLTKTDLPEALQQQYLKELQDGLAGYTYLEE